MLTMSKWRWIASIVVSALVMLPHKIAAEILWANVCREEPMASMPFCNTNLTWDDRVADYSHRVPVPQKIRMMIDAAAGYPELHIPPYGWWSEGLHGALQPCVCSSSRRRRRNNNHNNHSESRQGDSTPTTKTTTSTSTSRVDPEQSCRCPTSFPCPSALGNALNQTLWRRVGAAIGRQGRAINNVRHHRDDNNYMNGLTYWSPTINLQRDPRWGRNMEVPGEDPLVVAHYAKEFVRGLQYGLKHDGTDVDHHHHHDNDDMQDQGTADDNTSSSTKSSIPQVAACCKHMLANSLEGNRHSNISRHNFNALVSPDDLANYYLPPFQACVQAGSLGIMCSYNAINGLPSCTNAALLQDLVRSQWNFTGYIVSDCGAIQDVVDGHGLGTNLSAAAALALQAGMDLNCGDVYRHYLPQALDSGLVSPRQINTAFERLTKVQMQLGLFDHHHATTYRTRHPYLQYGIEDIDTQADQQLALEAAQQSIVLLQNHNQTLPLEAPISKLAVIGPHTFARQVFLSNYHGERCLYGRFDCIPSPVEAIRMANHGGTTVSSLGCHVKEEDDKDWIQKMEAAVQVAKKADAVMLLLGIDTTVEGEGEDRIDTTLPGLQLQLLDRILDLGLSRVIVVLIHGGSLSLGQERLKRIPALVSAPYGGQAAAQAMADVLFGAYNPTGKLVATMYPPNFVDQIPITEMGLQVGVGRTHMYYRGVAEFAFGHGLSYSRWKLDWHDKGPLHWNVNGPPLLVRLSLTNQGSISGAQTVLLVWRPKTIVSMHQKLIGFQGSNLLGAGEQFTTLFAVDSVALGVADSKGQKVVTPGKYTLVAMAASASVEMDLVVEDGAEFAIEVK